MPVPPLSAEPEAVPRFGSQPAGGGPAPTTGINRSTCAMGLTFTNALGLAAGIDRTGERLGSLAHTGVGHVEVGTVTDAREVAVDRARLPAGFRVGMNFASPRPGLDGEVIEDYVVLMCALWCRADYLVANLSSPSAGRTGDTPGVERLIERLAEAQDALCRKTGFFRPILAKVRGGACGAPLPRAVTAAQRHGLHGIVLATSWPERISEVFDELGHAAIISVGGIATPNDAVARLAAGARLVQIHSAFVAEGAAAVRRQLEHGSTGDRPL